MIYKLYRRKKRMKATIYHTSANFYSFNPAFRKNDKIIDINKLTIYNSKMINNVLSKKYIRRYKNLLKLVYLLFNDVFPDDSGYSSVLNESDKLKGILTDKYRKFLEIEEYEKYMKELSLIDNEVQKKFIESKVLNIPNSMGFRK